MKIEVKPCPHCINFCHIEVIRTAEKRPKNIRIGCEYHGYWLPESFSSVNDAVMAWNTQMVGGRKR